MDERVRWVTKAAASEELEISLSTLDRKIRKGEIEVVREGRRVYVRMHGPEYPNDEEVLRRAIAGDNELEPTVRELERKASEVELRASSWSGNGMRPGSPPPPLDNVTRSCSRRIGRSGRRIGRSGRRTRVQNRGSSCCACLPSSCRSSLFFRGGCWRRSWHLLCQG